MLPIGVDRGRKMVYNSFPSGVVYGIIATVAILSIVNRINKARARMQRQNRTLDTFSDSEQAQLTAAKIVRGSLFGILTCAFWFIILLIALAALIEAVRWIMTYKI
jgi:hypothetical protein